MAEFNFTNNISDTTVPQVTVNNEIADTTETHNINDNQVEITVTGNESGNWFFDAKANYKDKDNVDKSVDMVVSGTRPHYAKITINDADFNYPITLTGTYERSYEINNQTENCTVENLKEHYKDKEPVTIALTANVGHIFKEESKPTIKFQSSFSSYKVESTLQDGNKKAVFSWLMNEGVRNPRTGSYYLTGSAETDTTPVPQVTVNNEIADTTETHNINDNQVEITVTGNESGNWFFDAKANYKDKDNVDKSVDMVVSGTRPHYAKITINDADFNYPITLTGTYERSYEINNQTENCTVENLKEHYKDKEPVTIALTANVGHIFKEESKPTIKFQSSFSSYKVESTLQDGNKKAVFSWLMNEGVRNPNTGDYYLTGSAETDTTPPVGGKYGSINVYIVNDDALNQLAQQRFLQSTGTDGNVTAIDIGDYVNRIKRIYTDITESGESTLSLGNYNTGIKVKTPAVENITLDYGSVTVPAPNKDITDYDSVYKLFLPFKGFVSLSEEYAGKEINLQYVVNIITGNGVAKLSCDGIVFQVETVTPSLDVIYRTLAQDIRQVGDDSWNDFALYGIEPYLYATYYVSKSDIRNNDSKRSVLGDLTGFVSVDDVDIISTTNMLADEQEMIYNKLSEGVYIE